MTLTHGPLDVAADGRSGVVGQGGVGDQLAEVVVVHPGRRAVLVEEVGEPVGSVGERSPVQRRGALLEGVSVCVAANRFGVGGEPVAFGDQVGADLAAGGGERCEFVIEERLVGRIAGGGPRVVEVGEVVVELDEAGGELSQLPAGISECSAELVDSPRFGLVVAWGSRAVSRSRVRSTLASAGVGQWASGSRGWLRRWSSWCSTT